VTRINLERLERGEPELSYRALAERADLSPTTVAQFSTGNVGRIDLRTIDRLLTALEAESGRRIEVGELLVRTREPEVPA
jgi:DNA-binding Xre family transcriptional regulator